jgi:hypothetical protein
MIYFVKKVNNPRARTIMNAKTGGLFHSHIADCTKGSPTATIPRKRKKTIMLA